MEVTEEEAATKPVDPGEPSPPALPLLPAPAPPFPVPGPGGRRLSLPGRPRLQLWNLLPLLRGLSPAEVAGSFLWDDEGIVVTGSGTREGGEPFPQHRLS